MKIFRTLGFIIFYVWELAISSCRIAWDVLTPRHQMEPAFLKMPIDENLTDWQVLVLSNLLTMTPGTLSMDLSEDQKTLCLHIMYYDAENPDQFKNRELKSFEAKVRAAF